MSDVVIRFATPEDVGPIMEALEGYFRESLYSQLEDYDPELSVITIATYVEHGHAIIGERGGKIGGVLLSYPSQSFWRRPELGIDVFYVSLEWRGTPMGNKLIEAFVAVVKKHNYMFGIGASTSGFGSTVEKQFENTLKKHGFEPLGRACIYLNPKQGDAE